MQITGGFLAEGYGLTEASPVTHCNPVDSTMKTVKVGSIGLPLPDTDARIVDLATGEKTLGLGETGELAVKGPQVMKGYWRKPEETALVLRDGWLLTGDIAHMDEDGYFYITDRKKDLIKYKDYSVYPRELEDVLYEHPAVKLCAVIGKPDTVAGEVPKAFIVLKEGTAASAEEIMAFVNGKVASYKAIREVEFRKELPISSAGKVLRRLLQEEEKGKPLGAEIRKIGQFLNLRDYYCNLSVNYYVCGRNRRERQNDYPQKDRHQKIQSNSHTCRIFFHNHTPFKSARKRSRKMVTYQ